MEFALILMLLGTNFALLAINEQLKKIATKS